MDIYMLKSLMNGWMNDLRKTEVRNKDLMKDYLVKMGKMNGWMNYSLSDGAVRNDDDDDGDGDDDDGDAVVRVNGLMNDLMKDLMNTDLVYNSTYSGSMNNCLMNNDQCLQMH